MLNYSESSVTSLPADDAPYHVEELTRILKALADPSRLRIFNMLMEGVQCNCEIAERLGIGLSLISYHLSVLQDAGLVLSERDKDDARWIYYSVDQVLLTRLGAALRHLLDVKRIKPRHPSCGPRARST